MTRYYAHTRKLGPSNGEFELDRDGRTWATGQPAAELVLRALRTPRGSCPLWPEYGLDMTGLDVARTDAASQVRVAITGALAFLTREQRITNVRISVSVERDRLLYTVTFDDPRAGTVTVPGVLVLGV
jgi:hypothetical protein